MKAISLLQPWASLIAIGAKEIETRSWKTNYRGPLAIHASGTMRKMGKDACSEHEIFQALYRAGYDRYDLIYNPGQILPLGKVVAIANLVECLEIPEERKRKKYVIRGRYYRFSPQDPEYWFGDYTPGRFAWILAEVKAIDPQPAKGSLGIWEWEGGY